MSKRKVHGELSCGMNFHYKIPEGSFVFNIEDGRFRLLLFQTIGNKKIIAEYELPKAIAQEWREFCSHNSPSVVYDQGLTSLVQNKALLLGQS